MVNDKNYEVAPGCTFSGSDKYWKEFLGDSDHVYGNRNLPEQALSKSGIGYDAVYDISESNLDGTGDRKAIDDVCSKVETRNLGKNDVEIIVSEHYSNVIRQRKRIKEFNNTAQQNRKFSCFM